MGRPTKDPRLHELLGTKCEAAPIGESQVRAGKPSCPAYLSQGAKKIFRTLSKQLAERRMLTPGDQQALVLYATQFDRWLRSIQHVQAEGEVVQYTSLDKNGNEVIRERKNLHLHIAETSEKTMMAILVQLALTPLQRDKVKLNGAPVNAVPEPGSALAMYPELFKKGDRL